MIEIKYFDNILLAKVPDGYTEDFLKACADYQVSNLSLYAIRRVEAGRYFTVRIELTHGDVRPFMNHCRLRHNIKLHER